jgi:hypothetical protein
MVAMAIVMHMGAQALADDATGQPTVSKRVMLVQVANCMKKRMSADRVISYNAAARVCKNQVNSQSHHSESVAVVASDSPAKP